MRGAGERIGIRSDSKFTAPEPELAVLLGQGGEVLGYTLANDVSAWDIERENPLYLPQSKVYAGCCALGPWWVTPDELPPGADNLRIMTRLNGETMQDSTTGDMIFKVAQIVSILSEVMTLEPGDVIATGTPSGVGVQRKPQVFLRPGDSVAVDGACLTATTVRSPGAPRRWALPSSRLKVKGTLAGTFTATECLAALAAGATGLKIFPAFQMGAEGLKALRAVLPTDAQVYAVGGVGPADFATWLAAGAQGFGIGTALYTPGRSVADITARAAEMVAAYDGAAR